MTDLERVRAYLSQTADHSHDPGYEDLHDAAHDALELLPIIDAHLKEDAEFDASFQSTIAELTELREGSEENWRLYQDALAASAQEASDYEDELARLREDPPLRRALADEKAYAAELREQRDTLLAALREIRDELGVPNEDYAAPVANAVDIASAAIGEVEGER